MEGLAAIRQTLAMELVARNFGERHLIERVHVVGELLLTGEDVAGNALSPHDNASLRCVMDATVSGHEIGIGADFEPRVSRFPLGRTIYGEAESLRPFVRIPRER